MRTPPPPPPAPPPPPPSHPPYRRKDTNHAVAKTPATRLVLLLLAGIGAMLGAAIVLNPPHREEADKAVKKLTRDEFRAMVEGKTKEEILKLAGKPTTTNQHLDQSETWWYESAAIDPITNKAQTAVLHFDKEPSKLNSISFS